MPRSNFRNMSRSSDLKNISQNKKRPKIFTKKICVCLGQISGTCLGQISGICLGEISGMCLVQGESVWFGDRQRNWRPPVGAHSRSCVLWFSNKYLILLLKPSGSKALSVSCVTKVISSKERGTKSTCSCCDVEGCQYLTYRTFDQSFQIFKVL